MNEDAKRRGRQPKGHLHEDHNFRTSDEVAAADASPAAAESDQAGATGSADIMPQSTSAEPIAGAVVENPTSAANIVAAIQESIGDVISATITTEIKESPIEEKIHQLVDRASINGWHPIDTKIVIEMPPRNGMPVRLTENLENDGTLAVWKKTRKFANPTHRWEESGKWVDFNSGMDIPFQPKYWKERF